MALQRDWRPDPTGRHPFRELRDRGMWGDMVAESVTGDGMTADIEGGRLARGEPARAPVATPAEPDQSQSARAKWSGWAVVAVVVAVVGGGWWINNRDQERRAEAIQAALTPTSVEVCWSGTAGAVDVTLGIDGTIEQASDRANDQCLTKSARRSVVVSVQNTSGSGSLTCEIRTPSGTVLDTATSTGQYVIASCSAAV